MRITVLLGGTSSERDVSMASGLRISAALRERDHEVRLVDPATGPVSAAEERALRETRVKVAPPTPGELAALARNAKLSRLTELNELQWADVAFIALHGGVGEDGTIQALLDLAGIRYTGSGILASALAMDKDLAKRLFIAAGVPTPEWLMAPVGADRAVGSLGLPLIVKPSKQGSTVGLTIVRDVASFDAAVREAALHDDEVMIERFIAGREFTVAVLGDEAFPVGEIKPSHEIYDYECKYTPGMATEEFPADLPPDAAERMQRHALDAFNCLKLRGCARIDFRLGADGVAYCLEANTLPGMTDLSLVPQAAQAGGITFPELCERIALAAAPDAARSEPPLREMV
jgi:D-alanine-D-alanine ligase